MKHITELLLLIIIIGSLFFAFRYAGNDETSEFLNNIKSTSRDDNIETVVSDIDLSVELSKEIQDKSGIEIIIMEESSFNPFITAVGHVIDLHPIMEIRTHYNSLQSEINVLDSSLNSLKQEYERLQVLHKEASNISDRQMQQSRAELLSEQAKINAKKQALLDLKSESVQIWGKVLTDWIFSNNDTFRKLKSREKILILVMLQPNQNLPPVTDKIHIILENNNQEAYFISPAAKIDYQSQGKTYYFLTDAGDLQTGRRLDVRIPSGKKTLQGVTVPLSAVIWHVDKPWVYMKEDDMTFTRKELRGFYKTNNGFFVEDGLKPGNVIVVNGAQMLLSEEFRWSIPDEDDNP